MNKLLTLKEKPGDHQNDKVSSSVDHECQILWHFMKLLRCFSLDQSSALTIEDRETIEPCCLKGVVR